MKKIPHSEEAEKGFLGSLLQPTMAGQIFSELGGRIGSEHFFHPGRREIFDTIRRMFEAQKPIDNVTLTQQLLDQNNLGTVGGAAAIAELFNFVPTAANVDYYAEILRAKLIRREMIRVGTQLVRDAYEENEEEVILLDRAQAAVTTLALETISRPTLRHIAEGVYATTEQLESAWKHRGHESLTGFASGFVDIDRMTGGFKKQQLILIAARTSQGKSAMAMNIAAHLALGSQKTMPVPVAFYSMEMSFEELAARYTCGGTGISLQRLRDGKLSKEAIRTLPEKIAPLIQAPLYIDDTPKLAITDLMARARRAAVHQRVACVVVDYLQMMRSLSRRAKENKVIEIGEITSGLKEIAKELKIPVFACAQLNRETEKRPMGFPKLADLRESGSMENDADTVILLWRPVKHCETDKQRLDFAKKLKIEGENDTQSMANLEAYAEAILAKQRNGPTGRVRLRFDGELTQFQSMTKKLYSNKEEERQEMLED